MRWTTRSRQTQPGTVRNDRLRLCELAVYAGFALVFCRAVKLHLFPNQDQSLKVIAGHQYAQEIQLAPWRGTLYDRRGDPLAISVRKPSVAVNPRIFRPTSAAAAKVTRLLNLGPRRLARLSASRAYFAWVARQIEQRVADEIEGLDIPGLYILNEPARFYPAGSGAAHVLGFTGLDNVGLAGLELQFDKDLRGDASRYVAVKDARGSLIFRESGAAAPEKGGRSVMLTIDRAIQEIAEDELARGVREAKGVGGVAIVSDPHTGKILAVANNPSFDPNRAGGRGIAGLRNRALVDTFEPGSVTKPFLVAAALDDKKTTLGTMRKCNSGALRVGRHTIHDVHGADELSTADTVIRSSNICTFKLAQDVGREATYGALSKFGLGGNGPVVGFPGEASGYLTPPDRWANVRFANIAFGQGYVVTALEIVQAMNAIANGGRLMKPLLVERILSPDGVALASNAPTALRQVISPQVARTMRDLLSRVVTDEHGTAHKAAVEGFSVGGKTGTAQKVEPGVHGYAPNKFVASFVGMAPVEDPHVVIYVLIDEPGTRPYSGGMWAAPVFGKIAGRTLKYLSTASDSALADKKAAPQTATGAVAGNQDDEHNRPRRDIRL